MKLEYCGAYRNHGQHTIHSSSEMRQNKPGTWPRTDTKSVLASQNSEGIQLRFDGTANLNRNADYEFKLTITDQDLLELFEMRFGLETTVLDVKKELFGQVIKQRAAAGQPSPRIPLLSPPST